MAKRTEKNLTSCIGDQLTLVQMNLKVSSISDITTGDANASALRALTQNDEGVIQTRGRIDLSGSFSVTDSRPAETINDLRLEVRNIHSERLKPEIN